MHVKLHWTVNKYTSFTAETDESCLGITWKCHIGIKLCQCVVKNVHDNVTGFQNYFKDHWNKFDFITVLGSTTDVLVTNLAVSNLLYYSAFTSGLRLWLFKKLRALRHERDLRRKTQQTRTIATWLKFFS